MLLLLATIFLISTVQAAWKKTQPGSRTRHKDFRRILANSLPAIGICFICICLSFLRDATAGDLVILQAMIALSALAVAASYGAREYQKRKYAILSRRMHEGLCIRCGYDLRKSADRCPECALPVRRTVVLHNDDVNYFEHVVDVLVEIAHLDKAVAIEFAFWIHQHGSTPIMELEPEPASELCQKLQDRGLTASISSRAKIAELQNECNPL